MASLVRVAARRRRSVPPLKPPPAQHFVHFLRPHVLQQASDALRNVGRRVSASTPFLDSPTSMML